MVLFLDLLANIERIFFVNFSIFRKMGYEGTSFEEGDILWLSSINPLHSLLAGNWVVSLLFDGHIDLNFLWFYSGDRVDLWKLKLTWICGKSCYETEVSTLCGQFWKPLRQDLECAMYRIHSAFSKTLVWF